MTLNKQMLIPKMDFQAHTPHDIEDVAGKHRKE
jgi:hypothetical protein